MSGHALKVLIVEDEALIAMALEELLIELGHDVVGVATTTSEALEIVGRRTPDLALVDIQLAEGQSGIDLAYRLRGIGRTEVVFTSGNTSRIPRDYAGAVGAIGKPYSDNVVRSALEYLGEGICDPPPRCGLPAGFTLSPDYSQRWAA